MLGQHNAPNHWRTKEGEEGIVHARTYFLWVMSCLI